MSPKIFLLSYLGTVLSILYKMFAWFSLRSATEAYLGPCQTSVMELCCEYLLKYFPSSTVLEGNESIGI